MKMGAALLPLALLSCSGTASSPNKERLMKYLEANYGKHIIAGQMDVAWSDAPELDMIQRVFDDTGKYPALKGFDYLNVRFPRSWGGGASKQTEEAIEWWQNPPIAGKHGIVAFCWHWRVPLAGFERGGAESFYTNINEHAEDGTSFRIPYKNGALDKSGYAWKIIQEDLDLVASELAKLKRLDIPVLWRPFHEASGNWGKFPGGTAWFWWGASGPDAYKALWEYMYHYFTDEKKLTNLIWVWNGQDAAWFPDPKTVEIAGNDLYPPQKDYGSQLAKFNETEQMLPKGKKYLVALTENGVIPDPDSLQKDGAKWSWFMTWNDSTLDGTNPGNFWSGEHHNTAEHKKKVYAHEYVITLDKFVLPD
jgi:mannan endo-1,4-beta-mannosidase